MKKIDSKWLSNPNTQKVLGLLTDKGFEAYVVGGCVRNDLLGEPATDIDIATNATPKEVMSAAKAAGLKSIPTGIEHGTITIVIKSEPFEITTYRKDIETDGRRAVIAFSDSIIEDAKRRDFTMNAIYADADGNIIDPLVGMTDLLERRVRFINDAHSRITEDYLRILRFFRFHAFYGDQSMGFDQEALSACAANLDGLKTLSKERVGMEIKKLLSAKNPSPALATMQQIGILHSFLPAADASNVAILVSLEDGNLPDFIRRLAALGGEDLAENLRLSKNEARHLNTINKIIETGKNPARAAYLFGKTAALNAHLVLAAITETAPPKDLTKLIHKGASNIGRFPVKASHLPKELSGPKIGNTLRLLEDKWIASEFLMTKEELLA